MAKDIPLDTLLKEAAAHRKTLAGFADAAPKAAARIEGGFKKDKADLDWITQEIATNAKWLEQTEFDIGKAEKTLKQLSKLKEKEAKDAVRDLDAALGKTDKELEKLRGTMAVAEKLADKNEVEDKKLVQMMTRATDLGAQRLQECKGDVVTCPRLVDHLGKNVEQVKANALPVVQYLNVVKVFARDMQFTKAHIDDAERIAETLGKLAASGAKALVPEARQRADDCAALKKQLDTVLDKLRPELKQGLVQAAKWRDELSDKIKNAA